MNTYPNRAYSLLLVCFSSLSLLTACSSGGSSSTIPTTPISYPVAADNKELIKSAVWSDNGYDGSGVTVAVLDTGIADPSSVDFDVSVLENQRYDDQLAKTSDTYTYDTGGNNHGQDMAEIIGSQSVGIAPGATMVHGVISKDGYTDMGDQVMATDWAIDHNARIVNLSFSQSPIIFPKNYSSDTFSNTLKAVIDKIDATNTVIVHAAGNEGLDFDAPINESTYADIVVLQPDNILFVGAVNLDATLASYSNTPGSSIEYQNRFLVAPGDSTIVGGLSIGTSGATANVSGALALMKQRWSTTGVNDLAQILLDTANKNIPDYSPATHGQGMVDLEAAYSPVGTASFDTSTASLPLEAAAITLPAGFSTLQFNAAFVDQYHRDFEATFSTQTARPETDFSQKLIEMVSPPPLSIMHLKNGMQLGFKQQTSRYNVDSPILGFNGFAHNLFSQNRTLETILLTTDTYQIGFSTNVMNQYNSQKVNSTLDDAAGYITSLQYKNIALTYFASSEDQTNAFYGANNRTAHGVKATLQSDFVKTGIEYSIEKYQGSGLLDTMSLNQKAAFLKLDFLHAPSIQAGVIGKYTISDLNIDMTLPRSIGDGRLYYQSQTLKESQDNFAKGVYLNLPHFKVSAYSDKFDQNIALQFKTTF
ncbi:Intracellular serine protease [Hydrogenovibrio crunogenus]|uniref:Intracellular serine protease n=1 Tax=Hydrogenovibrio crunogenus TaxID=39765 RepID=A0A4P7P0H3_9GAMM|nr:Intracellular serine protease [Hydrogenovibrio crunogenus]